MFIDTTWLRNHNCTRTVSIVTTRQLPSEQGKRKGSLLPHQAASGQLACLWSFFLLLQETHHDTPNREIPSQWPGSASNYQSARFQCSKQLQQQALKTQAARNAAILQRTHLIALGVHGFHLLLRFTFVRRSFWAYLLLSFPSLLVQFWFERVGRPTYIEGPNGKELKRAGEDLEAKGLTEWMWDVVYWSWGCIVITTLVGDWAWWFFVSHSNAPLDIFFFTDSQSRLWSPFTRPGWHTQPLPVLVKASWEVVPCPLKVPRAARRASVNKRWKREAVRRCNTDNGIQSLHIQT